MKIKRKLGKNNEVFTSLILTKWELWDAHFNLTEVML